MTIVACHSCGSAYDGQTQSSVCPHTDGPGVSAVITMPFNEANLKELIQRVQRAFEGLSSNQKEVHHREQAISWVYGEMKLAGHTISHDEIARMYDNTKK